jgi:hypothetical protein
VRFVLLHSPLLGPLSWQAVAGELTARGHLATAPAWRRLSDVGEGFYPTLAADMADQVRAGGTEPAILVAHSGAGALMPALAEALGPLTAGVVFADALLPHPGRSWFDTAPRDLALQLRSGAPDGRLPRWDLWWPPGALERLVPDDALRARLLAELEPLPIGYFEEPAPGAALNVPAAFLQLSSAYDDEARVAGRQGWPVVSLPLSHLAMLTQPLAVAGALEGLAPRLS